MNEKPDKTAVNPRGTTINFSSASHRYWTAHRTPEPVSGDCMIETDYVSVTTLLKGYFPPFNEKEVAEQVAAKRGVPSAAVLLEWQLTREAACNFGTRTHEVCEDTLCGRAPRHVPLSGKERAVFGHGWTFANDVRQKMKIIAVEQIIFHESARVAGQIDFAARDGNGVLWIMDWKTNKEIRTSNGFEKTGLGPVAHLPECELAKYALQLSTYEWILRSEGYIRRDEPAQRGIVHLSESGAKFIPTPDLGREVLEIMLDKATDLPF